MTSHAIPCIVHKELMCLYFCAVLFDLGLCSVVGWGVGGIEAEAVMLNQPVCHLA